ncbi:hypothetical protein OR1_02689 [Geobacter sp. OR-1]|uniref:cupin domain-containing protein n=1 Tax=Geobacter sp. OR-1 TaxID=1266765 RepID=UPI000542A1D0|nr:cupin domain-containing protein [Geobacter sp. OR-1]GAM10400.1 hypothetical protein OR1_02689 [Geobacter sp. OR-1]
MTAPTAIELIRKLELLRHPEGGWYRETYRSEETIPAAALPDRFSGDRSFCTAIYFLLEKGDFSAFHRIKSDELWHFHSGTTLTIHMLSQDGSYQTHRLGADLDAGASFQAVVPAGFWFGAEVTGNGGYALVSCTVSPGFDFADFEMADRDDLIRQLPSHTGIIRQLTRESVTHVKTTANDTVPT